MDNIASLLKQLGIEQQQALSYHSQLGWLGDDSKLIESRNPSNNRVIASVHPCHAEQQEQIIQQAKNSFTRWSSVPAPQRGHLIYRIGQILRQNKAALGSLVSLEMGKIIAEGEGEVQEMIDMADFAVGQSRMLYGKSMHSERPQHRMYEQWHPLGVCGVISAFNFPVAVWAWNAFIAAIAGNTVIWKPSSQTPLCAVAVQQICNQAMQELDMPGVFSTLLPSAVSATRSFVDDSRLPLISFTGSSRTGMEVSQRVAARMGRSILECSGNNALIIDESARLELAIPAVVFGAIGTAGQRCTTTRRLLIHRSRFEETKSALQNAYRQVSIGDALNRDVLMGPLVSANAVAQYEEAVAKIRQQGEIVFGGERLAQDGHYVTPCLAQVEADSELLQHETFAPILYLLPVDDLDQAIFMQNNVPQGLSSALFTNSLQSAERFLSAAGSDCGIANVNIGTSGAEIGGAFGGEKATGGGREAGSDSWKAYMRRQTNCINWGDTLPLAQGIVFNLK